MKILSARYANPEGGILLEREGEPALYVDRCELYERAMAGEFGELGELPEPEPEPTRIPQAVTRRQAKQQLLIDGILDQVQPAIDAIADDIQRAMVQIYWDDATEFERANGELIALATSLGLDDEAVDALFIAASQR